MHQKEDGTYRTVFGPVFYHPGVVYESSDLSLGQAARRQTGVREPDIPGYHEWLSGNQFNYVTHGDKLKKLISELKTLVRDRVVELADYGSLLKEYVEQPHEKRKERIEAYQENLDRLECDHDTFVKFIEGKVKKDEVAKYGKYARLFVSLGPASILTGGFLVEYIKKAFVSFKPECCRFVPGPTRENLVSLFEEMASPKENVFMGYFSDDSVIALKCDDGIFRAEVDFASCDCSHMAIMFILLEGLAGDDWRLKSRLRAMSKQCQTAMRLKSRCDLKELLVKLQPLFAVLYSGSTLTTILNNLAEIVLYSSIIEFLGDHRIKIADGRRLVMDAANNCGYIVTCDPVEHMEQLTFLKYFPAMLPTGVSPCMSLGVPLRTIGTCRGDLPGNKKESWQDRVDNWNAMLVAAFIDAGHNSVMMKLRSLYEDLPALKRQTKELMLVRLAKQMPYNEPLKALEFIPDIHLALRYGCSVESVVETVELIGKSPNLHIRTEFTDAVFRKDYGLVDLKLVGVGNDYYYYNGVNGE